MRSSRPFDTSAVLAGAATLLGLIYPSFAVEADYSGQIRVVGGVDFAVKANHLDVEGGHAFVGTSDGVLIFDLADPENPVEVGLAPVPDQVDGVRVRDGVLYVAAHSAGVMAFDVRRPSAPVFLGGVATPGYARRLVLTPETGAVRHVFVAGDWFGVHVLDFGDPTSPELVGGLDTESAQSVAYTSGYLYVADGREGLLVVDAHRVSDLVVLNVIPESAGEVQVDGSTLHLGGSDYYQIYDISDPRFPVALGREEIGRAYGYGLYVTAIHVEDGIAHLAVLDQGPFLVDVSDPAAPDVFWGSRNQRTVGIDRIGPYVITAHTWSLSGSLLVTDTRGRRSPGPVGFVGTEFGPLDVEVTDDYAYAVSDSLFVVDISDPAAPAITGALPLPSTTRELAVAGPNHVVLTTGVNDEFRVVDVSDPSAPTLVASEHADVLDLRGVDVAGSFAFVSARPGGLVVFDLSDPSSPSMVVPEGLATVAVGNVRVSGDIAYVASSAGLFLVDTSIPTQPAVLSVLPDPGSFRDLVVRDGLAFVAVDYGEMTIVDVSDPTDPRILSQVEGVTRCQDIALDGDFAYVASIWNGVHVVDVSDPEAPRRIGGTMVPPGQVGWPRCLAFHGGLAYSGGAPGLAILPRHVPAGFVTAVPVGAPTGGSLSPARPNPFVTTTDLVFSASRRGPARVAIYDVAGRLVRELVDGTVPAGRHQVHWDGLDRSGRGAAAGVYFVRLELEGRAHVRTIQRVR